MVALSAFQSIPEPRTTNHSQLTTHDICAFLPMLLSIVIVSWNCKEELLRCVDSLTQYPYSGGQEIIVVDNDSQDGTVAALRERFLQVRVIQTGMNLGFGRAANQGLRHAQGPFLLFLNPDTTVPAGALDAA